MNQILINPIKINPAEHNVDYRTFAIIATNYIFYTN